MKGFLLFLHIVLISAYAIGNDVPDLKPKFQSVTLTEFTTLELSIFPDAGTQLIFPFKLDNPTLEPTLKIRLTNANGFDIPTSNEEMTRLILGQNSIAILGKVNSEDPSAKYVGNLFINIGGYNLSIVLKTTHDYTEHVSNVVFRVHESERDHIIENLVKRKTKQLEDAFKAKMDTVDTVAKTQSLGHIADISRINPKIRRFKDEGDVTIDGSRIEVYADKVLTYKDKFSVFYFELKNRSAKDFDLSNISLYSGEIHVTGDYKCDGPLHSDETLLCSFVTENATISKSPALKLVVNTNRGQGEFQW